MSYWYLKWEISFNANECHKNDDTKIWEETLAHFLQDLKWNIVMVILIILETVG